MSPKLDVRLMLGILPLALVLLVYCAPAEEFHRFQGGAVPGAGGQIAGSGGEGTPGTGGGPAGTGGGPAGTGGKGGSAGSGGKVGSGGVPGAGGSGSGGSAPSCTDGRKNQDETDIDCGGATCQNRCAAGKLCSSATDCATATPAMLCSGTPTKCVNPCTDGLKDGDETAIDCGGSCPLKCVGETCAADADCQSKTCDTTTNTCKAADHPLATIDETCWTTITAGKNQQEATRARTIIAPCMVTNSCCKARVASCTEACYLNDGICGVNKMGVGTAPYEFITAYYATCVK